eukprot:scaffold232585_cov77-Attheya_sp.AAC.9
MAEQGWFCALPAAGIRRGFRRFLLMIGMEVPTNYVPSVELFKAQRNMHEFWFARVFFEIWRHSSSWRSRGYGFDLRTYLNQA